MENAKELLLEGQGTFCDIIKVALYQEDETVFEHLDFENDDNFLEPMLFGYCTQRDHKVVKEQLLFGTWDRSVRPTQMTVYTNKNGVVYLPSYAILKTTQRATALELSYDRVNDSITLSKEDAPVVFKKETLVYLDALPQVELSACIDVYSETLFYNWPNVEESKITALLEGDGIDIATYQPAIEQALHLLKQYFPSEWEKYALTTRRLILFSSSELRNFATRESHGTIYLNVNENSNVTFFLEELIHQCSHTVFNAMTCETQDFFLVDYSKTVGDFLGNNDYRTLYSALHGIYTTGQIVDLFLKLIKAKPDLSARLIHELEGRIAINKTRHNIGLEKVNIAEIFTPKGQAIFQFYYKQLDENMKNNTAFFDYDMRTHPVVFNYAKFEADNPMPVS
ncbi:MAG: hypothetical protein AB8E82_01855 [Aureispira sp.]